MLGRGKKYKKAKMGEELAMYYNEELKCWLMKGEEDAKRKELASLNAPPPLVKQASLDASPHANGAGGPPPPPMMMAGAAPPSGVASRYAMAPAFGAPASADNPPSALGGLAPPLPAFGGGLKPAMFGANGALPASSNIATFRPLAVASQQDAAEASAAAPDPSSARSTQSAQALGAGPAPPAVESAWAPESIPEDVAVEASSGVSFVATKNISPSSPAAWPPRGAAQFGRPAPADGLDAWRDDPVFQEILAFWSIYRAAGFSGEAMAAWTREYYDPPQAGLDYEAALARPDLRELALEYVDRHPNISRANSPEPRAESSHATDGGWPPAPEGSLAGAGDQGAPAGEALLPGGDLPGAAIDHHEASGAGLDASMPLDEHAVIAPALEAPPEHAHLPGEEGQYGADEAAIGYAEQAYPMYAPNEAYGYEGQAQGHYEGGYEGAETHTYGSGFEGAEAQAIDGAYEGTQAYDGAYQSTEAQAYDGGYPNAEAQAYDGGYPNAEAQAYDGGYQSTEAQAYDGGYHSTEAQAYDGGYQITEAQAYDGDYQSTEAQAYDGSYDHSETHGVYQDQAQHSEAHQVDELGQDFVDQHEEPGDQPPAYVPYEEQAQALPEDAPLPEQPAEPEQPAWSNVYTNIGFDIPGSAEKAPPAGYAAAAVPETHSVDVNAAFEPASTARELRFSPDGESGPTKEEAGEPDTVAWPAGHIAGPATESNGHHLADPSAPGRSWSGFEEEAPDARGLGDIVGGMVGDLLRPGAAEPSGKLETRLAWEQDEAEEAGAPGSPDRDALAHPRGEDSAGPADTVGALFVKPMLANALNWFQEQAAPGELTQHLQPRAEERPAAATDDPLSPVDDPLSPGRLASELGIPKSALTPISAGGALFGAADDLDSLSSTRSVAEVASALQDAAAVAAPSSPPAAEGWEEDDLDLAGVPSPDVGGPPARTQEGWQDFDAFPEPAALAGAFAAATAPHPWAKDQGVEAGDQAWDAGEHRETAGAGISLPKSHSTASASSPVVNDAQAEPPAFALATGASATKAALEPEALEREAPSPPTPPPRATSRLTSCARGWRRPRRRWPSSRGSARRRSRSRRGSQRAWRRRGSDWPRRGRR
ncbi:hypothetical protein QBZ16_000668 [Prototheca wickerhamii]|uniref:Uncharacterized protein n=1 Tax=Prototheca wickerhamii TaxID=3111 RepID=A0AAD9INQ2_PROWI|nr:hypothetical protein QBZ16_000668 [Prototheca wickerhamii]